MSTNTENIVSWQSAFWGVLLIGVNTFLQQPGAILPTTDNSENNNSIPDRVLRASPFVCLVDALDLVVRIVFHRARGDSLRKASSDILAHRSLESLGAGSEQLLRRSWALRVMAGVFALIQLVKLCGMQGIPWTAFSGCCYFADWALLEVLDAANTVGNLMEKDPPQPLVSEGALSLLKNILVFLTSFLSSGVLFWMYGHLILTDSSVEGMMLGQAGLYRATFWTAVLIIILACVFKAAAENIQSDNNAFIVAAGPWIILYFCHVYVKDEILKRENWRDDALLSGAWIGWRTTYWFGFAALPVSCTLIWAALAVAIVTYLLQPIREKLKIKTVQVWWGALLSCSFVVVLFHYARREDFSQTNKPEWVQWLG